MSPLKRRLLRCNHGLPFAAMMDMPPVFHIATCLPPTSQWTTWTQILRCGQQAIFANNQQGLGPGKPWPWFRWRHRKMEEKPLPRSRHVAHCCWRKTSAQGLTGFETLSHWLMPCLMRCDGRWSNGGSFDFHNWLRNLCFFSEFRKYSC